jgi:hypothetical protein
MLAKDRDERPRDGAEVVAALTAIGDIPDGPRRSRATADAPTDIVSRRGVATEALPDTPPVSIVLVAADPDGGEVPVGLDALVARFEGRLAVLDSGTLVVTIDATGEHAGAAARCALALGARLPGRPIIVATASGPGGLQAALDRGARLLEADEIAAVFRRNRVAIRVDDATQALLDDRFQLEPSPNGALLRGGP